MYRDFQGLLAACKGLAPAAAVAAHPCDTLSLQGVCDAARLGLILPVLVGSAGRIRAAAEEAHLDIAACVVLKADPPLQSGYM